MKRVWIIAFVVLTLVTSCAWTAEGEDEASFFKTAAVATAAARDASARGCKKEGGDMPGVGLGLGLREAGQSATWYPTELGAGLEGFWLAEDVHPQSAAPRWADSSGLGRYLTFTNGNWPAYQATAIAGLPGLRFDTNTQTGNKTKVVALTTALSDWRFLHDGSDCTIAIVAKPLVTTSQNMVIDTSNLTGAGLWIAHDGGIGRWLARIRNASGDVLTLNGAPGYPVGKVYTVLYEMRSGVATLRVNGVEVGRATASGAFAVGVDPAGQFAIGSRNAGNTNCFEGDVMTALPLSRAITASERAKIETHAAGLRTRRALHRVWTLGDSHTNSTYQSRLWIRSMSSPIARLDYLGIFPGTGILMPDTRHSGQPATAIDGVEALADHAALDAVPTVLVAILGANNFDGDGNPSVPPGEAQLHNFLAMLVAQHPHAQKFIGAAPRFRPPQLAARIAALDAFRANMPAIVADYPGCVFWDADVPDNQVSADGVHLTTAGYDAVGDMVADLLGI